MGTMIVVGNYGALVADAETGLVLSYTPDPYYEPDYQDIVILDVAEFRHTYPDQDLTAQHFDILDVGFWDDEGRYAEPEMDWRQKMGRTNHE